MIKKIPIAGITLLGALLAGCASTGSSEFGCSGMPDGVNCAPASDLYNLVDKPGFENGVTEQSLANHKGGVSGAVAGGDRVGNLSRRGSGRSSGVGDRRGKAAAPNYFGVEPVVPQGSPDHLLLLNPPVADSREPIRTQAVQQRVWVAPWVNKSGVWHGQQVIYLEVAAREWQNGIIGGEPSMPIFKPLDQ